MQTVFRNLQILSLMCKERSTLHTRKPSWWFTVKLSVVWSDNPHWGDITCLLTWYVLRSSVVWALGFIASIHKKVFGISFLIHYYQLIDLPIYIYTADVAECYRGKRLYWWCSVSKVWDRIPSRKNKKLSSQKSNSNTVRFNIQTYINTHAFSLKSSGGIYRIVGICLKIPQG